MLIENAVVVTGAGFHTGLKVRTENGRIMETGEDLSLLPGEERVDLEGDYLLPGFVDVHIHAYQGRDTMEGEEAVRAMSRGLAQLGVAAFCPTAISVSSSSRISRRSASSGVSPGSIFPPGNSQ